MKCKACNAEFDDDVTQCPVCGFDNRKETDEQTVTEEIVSDNETETSQGDKTVEAEVSSAEENVEQTEEKAAPETPAAPAQEQTPVVEGKISGGKIALLVVLAIAAIAVVAALIVGGLSGGSDPKNPTDGTAPVETTEATIPEDGNPDDETAKGTYTVTDEEILAQKDAVVATLGDAKLTNGQLQVYYWLQVYDFMQQYGQFAQSFGMNITQPLDTQKSIDPNLTWQQFFLREAIKAWKNYTALTMKGTEEGFTMDEEYAKNLEDLASNMEQAAKQSGFETVEEMIQSDMGVGADFEAYKSYMESYHKGFLFYGSKMDQVEVSDEDVEAFFDSHVDEYGEKGLKKDDEKVVDVRHILLTPEGGTTGEDGQTTYSDEEWAACEAAAQAVLDEYLAGEQTQERFAELAVKYSKDPGSAQKGGLYAGVYKGQMVAPFEEWSFDDSREAGNYGLVKTDYGYHVMYFVDSHKVWYTTAKQDLLAEKGNEYLKSVVDEYPFEVDYSAVALGFVNLAKES